jgi:hypothetical protein
MSKQVITVEGEQRLVREDTAKAYRGVYWALISILAFIIIAAMLFFGGFLKILSNWSSQPAPAATQQSSGAP